MGTLNIVGIGPGNDEHITPAALQAIKSADHVIGYTTYLRLIKQHIVGKTITRTGMSEEIERARTAILMAREEKNITIVSSGDAGVYGMAGLIFDVLKQMGWKRGDEPKLNIIPGISAANSCGSLVGAPLVHDACTISLSDLLTPWPVIAKRIEGAAMGDFVISFYNPASGRRQRQIVEAQKIILKYRPGSTPVALVKSGYRKAQQIIISDLDHFLEYEIGMLTTVIVGSSQTYLYEGYMVTPRGYVNKYDIEDGNVHIGQRKTFSLRCEGDLSDKSESHLFAKTYTTPTDNWVTPKDIHDTSFLAEESAASAIEILSESGLLFNGSHETTEYKILLRSTISLFNGSLVFFDGQKTFLIGDFKEPTNLAALNIKIVKSESDLLVREIVGELFDIKPLFFWPGEGIETARDIYQKLAVYRNHLISGRLCSYISERAEQVMINEVEFRDANWVAKLTLEEWEEVRSVCLKCS